MQIKPQALVTVIADRGFVLPVYILILSLKQIQPEQRIHVLGISLSAEEKKWFTQFSNVFVFDASLPRSGTPGAMRVIADLLKAEALLTAKGCDEPWIALLDGDCIATGDISPYLAPSEPALYVRSRPAQEDHKIFRYRRKAEEPGYGIPPSFLNRWQADVGQKTLPARSSTVCSGNLVVHRSFLDRIEEWGAFMRKVLPSAEPFALDQAYYMPAEFALSAWLMFAETVPPVREVLLNSNPDAFLAHLGPAPVYWRLWTRRNLRYFDRIMQLLDQAENDGFAIPVLPYTLKKRNKPFIQAAACGYEALCRIRWAVKPLLKKIVKKPDAV